MTYNLSSGTLNYTILYYTILYYTILYYTILYLNGDIKCRSAEEIVIFDQYLALSLKRYKVRLLLLLFKENKNLYVCVLSNVPFAVTSNDH